MSDLYFDFITHQYFNMIDSTDQVELYYQVHPVEEIALKRCICGKSFDLDEFRVSEKKPKECPVCHRKLKIEYTTKVYEIKS